MKRLRLFIGVCAAFLFLPVAVSAAAYYYFDEASGVSYGPHATYPACQLDKPAVSNENLSDCIDLSDKETGKYFYYYNGMIFPAFGSYDTRSQCETEAGGGSCFMKRDAPSGGSDDTGDGGGSSGSGAGSGYGSGGSDSSGAGGEGSAYSADYCDEGYEKMAGVCVPLSSEIGLSDREPGQVIVTVMNWLMAILGILAILMLVVAGMMYLTAAGDEKRTDTAKKIIMYVIMGVAVALMAYIIVYTVEQLVTGGEEDAGLYY